MSSGLVAALAVTKSGWMRTNSTQNSRVAVLRAVGPQFGPGGAEKEAAWIGIRVPGQAFARQHAPTRSDDAR